MRREPNRSAPVDAAPGRRGGDRRKILLAATLPAALLLLAAAAFLPGRGGTATAGRTTARFVPPPGSFAVVELGKLAARSGGTAASAPSAAAGAVAPSSVTLVPLVSRSFPGKGDTGEGKAPDPSGAAGPRHLVSLNGNGLLVQEKAGGSVASGTGLPLREFWSAVLLDTGDTVTAPFSPKVLYDQYGSRFVAVSLHGRSGSDSHLLLAVSATDDPTGTWYQWSLPQGMAANPVGDNTWAGDASLGLDGTSVYVSVSVFSEQRKFNRSRILVLPRPLLQGPPVAPLSPPPAVEDPTGVRLVPDDPTPGDGVLLEKEGFAIRPVHAFGETLAPWFLYLSTYFYGDFQPGVEAGRYRTRYVAVGRLVDNDADGTFDNVAWGYQEVPGFSDIAPSGSDNVIQRGTETPLSWGDPRLQGVVFRGGFLYGAHAAPHYVVPFVDAPPSLWKFHADVHWFRLDPASTGTAFPAEPDGLPDFPTHAEPGARGIALADLRADFRLAIPPSAAAAEGYVVKDPSGAMDNTRRSFFYPTLAVNGEGDVALGFSGVSGDTFVSAYVTGKKAGETEMLGIFPLKGGEGSFSGPVDGLGRAVWGTSSATCVDPSDDLSFWTLQEYAESPGATVGRFGTWWGMLDVAGVPPNPQAGGDGIFGTGGGGGCSATGAAGGGGLLLPLLAAALALARAALGRKGGTKK